MTRIDFHSNVPDKVAYACRLVRKARLAAAQARAASHIVLRVDGRAELGALDAALWTFSEHDFVPHVLATHPLAAQTPVLLTDSDSVPLPEEQRQILINLSQETPANFSRFERVFEIVSSAEADRAAGRGRYAWYKQQGYPLTHFVAEPRG